MQASIQMFSALLTPVIAAIAVYIAHQQWQTNCRRLELDSCDRRLRVYQAVSQFISKVLTDLSPQPQDFSDYRIPPNPRVSGRPSVVTTSDRSCATTHPSPSSTAI